MARLTRVSVSAGILTVEDADGLSLTVDIPTLPLTRPYDREEAMVKVTQAVRQVWPDVRIVVPIIELAPRFRGGVVEVDS